MSIKISMNLFPVPASLAIPACAAPVAIMVADAPVASNIAAAPVTCMVGAAPLEPAAFNSELSFRA